MAAMAVVEYAVVEHTGGGDRVVGRPLPRMSPALAKAQRLVERGRDVDVLRVPLYGEGGPVPLRGWR